MISDPSMMIHIDPKCPDSNQTPTRLPLLYFGSWRRRVPHFPLRPLQHQQWCQSSSLAKSNISKWRNQNWTKEDIFRAENGVILCHIPATFWLRLALMSLAAICFAKQVRRLRQVDGHRSHRSRGAMNQRFGVDESTTGGVDNPRVHGIPAFREAISNISRQRIHKKIMEYHMDVDLRFALDPLRFSKHFRPSYLWTL